MQLFLTIGAFFFFGLLKKNFYSDFATLTFSLAQCRTTHAMTTGDDWLCKTKERKIIIIIIIINPKETNNPKPHF